MFALVISIFKTILTEGRVAGRGHQPPLHSPWQALDLIMIMPHDACIHHTSKEACRTCRWSMSSKCNIANLISVMQVADGTAAVSVRAYMD